MQLTKRQRFFINLNQKIKNKMFENYYDALKYLNELLLSDALSYEDYWLLVVSANDIYNKGE